ncbi:UDP-glucosyltransferase 2-like [Manduca sexta]|uniref:UDP-glucuronosyltransferase n=1 Tax=Manduca sexta TaxID=7130 RepID=A0A922CT79_MANSE|nr:UDP-glucosyltransferase 2-like [Manduca sexta]KAG6458615.1 UDP-glycosyltransferase [Manduca sexta]
MTRSTWLLLGLLTASQFCDAYRILVVFPLPGKSHSILGFGVVNHLLKAGHDVTFVTPILEKSPHPKLHQIDISKNFDYLPKNTFDLKSILNKESTVNDPNQIISSINLMLRATYRNENVQKLLNDVDQKFDLVIVEWLYCELGAGIAEIVQAPLIWVSSLEPHWMVMRLIDEGLNPAYHGDALRENIPPFNFWQRTEQLWIQLKTLYYMHMYHDAQQSAMYDEVIAPLIRKRGRVPATFQEVKYNASLVLGNSHVSLGMATRLPQSYKAVGGYHINEEVKPLPEDLQKIMDNAKKGVVYFSMGSNLNSKDMPESLKKSLLDMFGELEQTVFWKFEEDFPKVPKNVHILEWAPQASILAHPNCVLFITHGGLLSTTETIHYGVPIIGIPVFADQFVNVNRAVGKGIAKKVDFSFTMAEDLRENIVEMTSNPKYREKVKELSFIYHDRPVRPGAELVHWVEHVIQTKGAPHLRSPAINVPWYQKMYLDLAVVVVILVILSISALKRVYCLIFPKNVMGDKKYK